MIINGLELYKTDLPGEYRMNVEVRNKVNINDVYANLLAQLKQIELRGIDIVTLPLLLNNRGFAIVSNNGSLIYTEEP